MNGLKMNVTKTQLMVLSSKGKRHVAAHDSVSGQEAQIVNSIYQDLGLTTTAPVLNSKVHFITTSCLTISEV